MTTTIIKKRIEYLDALRGFTMLLVIFGHITLFSFNLSPDYSILCTLLYQFHMPLFFFISGFLAYNPKIIWTGNTWISATKKKLRVQIVPTLIFGLLFTYLVLSKNIYTFLATPMKLGYWFTISLLEMFLIYYTVNYLVYKCNPNKMGGVVSIALIIIAVICYFVSIIINKSLTISKISDYFCAYQTFVYLQFFVFGNIAASHFYSFNRLLDNKYFTGCIIFLFFCFSLINMEVFSPNALGVLPSKLLYFISILGSKYCGLLIVFSFFKKYQASFTSSSRIGAGLQYIGRRTLDIYLLHYFFLPTLPYIGDFFRETPNMLLELICGLTLSLLIAGLCLLVSNIIRISDFLGHWLFGAKITQKS